MKTIKGITSPEGFKASTISCGIKRSKRDDLALLYSEVPCLCAATFTTNKMKSGSVVLAEDRVKNGIAQAVIVNSGNANCCVGKKELRDAEDMTGVAARSLDLDPSHVLIASTGIIGRPLPIKKIKSMISALVKGLKKANGPKFAKAIMTTDTVPKETVIEIKIGPTKVKIAGAVKGAGMICPDMATMLAFFTTDAAIEKGALRLAFKEAVADSFNRITIDGDMSTNDSAIIFANGLAGNKTIKKNSVSYFKFFNALKNVATELARKMILDGEGATKFVEIVIKGAKTQKDADTIARHVADSSLIKAMIAGGDPNWGRVAASVGSAGVKINKNRVDIYIGNKSAMKNGAGVNKSLGALKGKEVKIIVDLKSGRSSSKIWTCDLTEEYVR
ncbi:MAG: bifunctional glutamate N-acetyltransferase/amino-acid acetyltransferase ArgJ, partial [Candidatus Omnitrophica bacterium]|nr:bifunctional glutamate N-acetyltransferase/amino-acid acetyltransferase ArgJ [Candidatus Omnitrophota bacterium]